MNRYILSVLSLGHLSVDIGAGALPALLPFLQREFHFSYFSLAALVMTAGITSSIMQPLFGLAADSLRTRVLLPIGVLLGLGGYAAVGMASTYALVVVIVAAAGIGSAMYHPEATKSARTVSGHLPATGNAYFAVGGNIGVALGPIIITLLIAWRGLPATVVLFVPALVIAAIVATVVPAVTQAHEEHHASAKSAAHDDSGVSVIALLVTMTSLRSAVYSGVLTFVPLYAVNVLHQPFNHNGLLLSVFLATGAAANLVAGSLADRFGIKRTMSLSLGLAPFALALYVLSSGLLAWIGLAVAGAMLIGTFSTSVVLGMEYMPHRLALASALLIGLSTGLGGLIVAALGRVADAFGLAPTLWTLVAIAVLAYGLTFALPKAAATPRLLPKPSVG
ncbi:MAG: MFS transporter [Candidatus Eremiobacteraeota bacterium]|nr:MFS transporter [Candidatus Eremiobacteraeota bacterium]MBV8340420.1 MFS transporter [Candidatus Eremiobacteraeota bacterium]MBV8595133.1 MFS transporter [Candidatus Eremiobacteraeota bacterium]